MDLCPSCGDWVSILQENTGWCLKCTRTIEATCNDCGRFFTPDQPTRTTCSTCRYYDWLLRNADLIEEHLASGTTLTEAIRQTKLALKPNCRCCGKEINQGYFCTDNTECRKAFLRYKRNKFNKNMAEEQAIREALAA